MKMHSFSNNMDDDVYGNIKYRKHVKDLYKHTLEYMIKYPNEIRCRHGAAVLKNNKIISFGRNHYKGFPKKSIHAERDAIMNCDRNALRDCTLLVIRISRDITKEEMLISKPCHKCTKLIKAVKIPKIYYSV